MRDYFPCLHEQHPSSRFVSASWAEWRHCCYPLAETSVKIPIGRVGGGPEVDPVESDRSRRGTSKFVRAAPRAVQADEPARRKANGLQSPRADRSSPASQTRY